MVNPYTIWVTFIGITIYICVVDPNVPVFLSLHGHRLKAKVKGLRFLLWENPDLPWVRWRIQLHYDRQARILRKELGLPDE